MAISSGLPLLIVGGKFQSLHTMTVEELETFIPFMVKCSLTRGGAGLINGVPEWWLSDIKFKFPLKKSFGFSETSYKNKLCFIVCSCYWYHNAEYLLQFSSEIANNPDSVIFKSNENNTTSVFYAHNNICLLKFLDENKNYDAKPKTSNRRLLPSSSNKGCPIPDIYLCENCDAEFSSYLDMQKHEKTCCVIIIDDESESESECDINLDGDSRESVEILILENITLGDKFFKYLGLEKRVTENTKPVIINNKGNFSSKHWINIYNNLSKNQNIEFSSLYGRKLLQNCVNNVSIKKIEKSINQYECYCGTTLKTFKKYREPSDFKISYRKMRKPLWTHNYSFNKSDRSERINTIKTGLNKRSRKLLKNCKEFSIIVHRIKEL